MIPILAATALIVIGALIALERYLAGKVADDAHFQKLAQRRNPPDIYGRSPDGHVYAPFSAAIDHMVRLMLLNFADDDESYEGLELQIFDNEEKGHGAALLIYRKDSSVEFYAEPGVTPDREKVGALVKVVEWVEDVPMDYRFDITPSGLDVDFKMEAPNGRTVAYRVKEASPRNPFSLLAPVASGSEAPDYLPLVHLREFDLVRKPGTEISAVIDGVAREPAVVPVPLPQYWKPIYFSRYSSAPVIGRFNDAHDGPLARFAPGDDGRFWWEGAAFDLIHNAGYFEIRRVAAIEGEEAHPAHEIAMTFYPPVPDLAAMKDGASVRGRFSTSADGECGIIRGDYAVERAGDTVRLSMQPTEEWWPPGGFRARLTLMLFPAFIREWPKSYRWEAALTFGADGEAVLKSRWERVS